QREYVAPLHLRGRVDVGDARRGVASQKRRDRMKSGGHDLGRDRIPRMRRVREAMEEDDERTIASLEVSNLDSVGHDRMRALLWMIGSPARASRAGAPLVPAARAGCHDRGGADECPQVHVSTPYL